MDSRERAERWLDGPGGDACVATDQSRAVPLLAAEFDAVRAEALEEAVRECYYRLDVRDGWSYAQNHAAAEAIRALKERA